MTEYFLQYIWQHRLYLVGCNLTDDGERVEVLQPGQQNTDAGPDFLDARVRIGDTLWAGCVEVHMQSSDWERHGHHTDPAYNNVILHVVYQHDTDIYNERRQKIPVMELHFDERYLDSYKRLANSKDNIACRKDLRKLDDFTMSSWMDRLAIERLEQKAEAIMQVYIAMENDWEETFYQRLARNFGFSLNALPFESVAKSLPLKTLLKHKDSLMQIEALLFGQAGMLEEEQITDEYFVELKKEYQFLQKKYNLTPIDSFLWKFLRLRPVNFPTLRISQFANLIYRHEHLFSQIIRAENITSLEKLFNINASQYWETRYVFGKESPKCNKQLGKLSIRTLIINTVVPFLFVYGKARGMDDFCTRAISFLDDLPAEKNNTLEQWDDFGIKNTDAFISQALLQLNNEYCQPRRCLSCAIGNRIIRNSQ